MEDGRVQRPQPDDASLVLRIRIGNQSVLLTSDIEREGEAALLRRPEAIQAQVLKVPHHGARSSSGEAFVAAVRPEVAVVSVGYLNRFSHPHPEVVERYVASGIRLLRTDLDGAISVELTPEGIRAWGRREAPEWKMENRQPTTDNRESGPPLPEASRPTPISP